MQVAAGLQALHAMYGDEFMAALKRCMEQDTERAQKESTLEKWMVLLHSVQIQDAKHCCFCLCDHSVWTRGSSLCKYKFWRPCGFP